MISITKTFLQQCHMHTILQRRSMVLKLIQVRLIEMLQWVQRSHLQVKQTHIVYSTRLVRKQFKYKLQTLTTSVMNSICTKKTLTLKNLVVQLSTRKVTITLKSMVMKSLQSIKMARKQNTISLWMMPKPL